jgi:LPXTG-site transpeptidase (sortase) family protein
MKGLLMKNEGEIYKNIFNQYLAKKAGNYQFSKKKKIKQENIRIYHGDVDVNLSNVDKFSYRVLRILGASLVGFSLIYLFFIFQPVVSEEINYALKNNNRAESTGMLTLTSSDQGNLVREEAGFLGLDPNFSVYVPKIDAKGNVVANVDPSNEVEYQKVLKDAVAHTKGTFFPGQNRLIYLFSHSTDSSLNAIKYNAVFYLLGELEKGDKIILYFSGKKYVYAVREKVIAAASDTSYLTKNYDEETLILQTCYPPGTSFKRLLIIANRLDN